jgi:hypothetical protein
MLKIPGLEAGHYVLQFKEVLRTVCIRVHRGKYWENLNYILKEDDCLIESNGNRGFTRITKVEFKPDNTVTIKVDSDAKDTRVHVAALQYLPHDPYRSFVELAHAGEQTFEEGIFPFQNWNNFYLSNRKLGDEMKYVLDRKNEKRFVGNSLEKPRLLLKRNFIQDTNFD